MEELRVEDLSFDVDGKSILKDVSFSLEKGTVTLIAGRNGSGKTMLLKCLKGLEKETKGSIVLEGKTLKKRKDRLSSMALVFQDASLEIVGSTVEKDIRFGLENQKKSPEEIKLITDEILTRFNIEHLRKSSPRYLSGGEKRKVAIASVVAMEPKLVLLDEPLANLDYPSTKLVLETIKYLKSEGVTVVIVSHEAEKLLALTDRTIIIEKGSIVYDGESKDSIEELRKADVFVPPLPFEGLSWL